MTQRTIHFISLGCPKNRVDTEVMLGVSDEGGYQLTDDPGQADVIVVNTCGFIGEAKQESIDTILEMGSYKSEGRCERLVVTGCLSQRYGEALAASMPEVDHFLGTSDMLKLRDVLAASNDRAPARMLVGNPADYTIRATDPRRISTQSFSAYLKIAEGCSRSCSFCSIPSFRGTQRSRPIHDIVAEAHRLIEQGVVELNVISQDTVSYGRDLSPRSSLIELIHALTSIGDLKWLRLFYLYPEKLSEELLDVIAHHPKVVPYIDMPLQHASDSMLRRMRRGHGGDRMRRLIERMRARADHLTFRSAFIVGHPGETDEDFEELSAFVEWAQLDHMGVFLYSHEEGTRSGNMIDLVAARTARSRQRKLMSLQRRISRKKLRGRVGETLEVLVEGVSDESDLLLEGRHRGQAPEIDGKVILTDGTARPGEIRRARVTHASDYDLVASLEHDVAVAPPRLRVRSRRLPIAL